MSMKKDGKEKEQIQCIICGKLFTPRNSIQLCCSPNCSEKNKSFKNKIYAKERAARIRKQAEEKNAQAEASGSIIRYCKRCGKEFIWSRGMNGKYCRKCVKERKESEQRVLELLRTGEPKPKHLCADCHKVYTFNHRCPKCLEKWRKKHGVRTDCFFQIQEEDPYHAFI